MAAAIERAAIERAAIERAAAEVGTADVVSGWARQRAAGGPSAAPAAVAPRTRGLSAFALVSLGQLVTMTGSHALAFALGLWVFARTGSVTEFSAILVTAVLPGLVALPFAGAAADRWNRRLLMVVGALTNATGTVLCLGALLTGSLDLWFVYLAASLISVATAIRQPAYLASVAQLVPKIYLARVNGFPLVDMILFFLAFNLALGVAPALLPPMVLTFAGGAVLGVVTMLEALGGVVGGVVMAVWDGTRRRATGMIGFVLLTGVGLVVAGLRPWPWPWPVVLGLAAVMASIALINGHWQAMVQVTVGAELQGRILTTNRMIANLTEPVGYVVAGLLAGVLVGPAAARSGPPAGLVAVVAGEGRGRGIALLVVLLGVVFVALGVAGLRWRSLRFMEDALPDAVPGAVLTWDRDALQREADAALPSVRVGAG